MTEEELKSLETQNKICSISWEIDRVNTTLKDLSEEIKVIKDGQSSLIRLRLFLESYQHVLEGSIKPAENAPWLPLMDMVLSLLKSFSHISNQEMREGIEADVLHSFLAEAEKLGFKEPVGCLKKA